MGIRDKKCTDRMSDLDICWITFQKMTWTPVNHSTIIHLFTPKQQAYNNPGFFKMVLLTSILTHSWRTSCEALCINDRLTQYFYKKNKKPSSTHVQSPFYTLMMTQTSCWQKYSLLIEFHRQWKHLISISLQTPPPKVSNAPNVIM